MKHAGTIVSKPVYKEDFLQELADTVSGLRKKTTRFVIGGFSVVAGAILIKTYMTLSQGWLLADKIRGRFNGEKAKAYPYPGSLDEKYGVHKRAA